MKSAIPFEHIHDNLAGGPRARAHRVDDARLERPHRGLRADAATESSRRGARTRRSIRARRSITANHALASAAIPILFRSVRIDGEFHCDGGLRQNVPLSPARRLGADAVLVINPRFITDEPARAEGGEAFPGPLFLLGKTLNALLLDRIDTDLARLESVNKILDAGTRVYGADFVTKLNAALGHKPGHGLRPMRAMLVRASQDIGALAAEFVREHCDRIERPHRRRSFAASPTSGDDPNESDLLSYVLFDGRFAKHAHRPRPRRRRSAPRRARASSSARSLDAAMPAGISLLLAHLLQFR